MWKICPQKNLFPSSSSSLRDSWLAGWLEWNEMNECCRLSEEKNFFFVSFPSTIAWVHFHFLLCHFSNGPERSFLFVCVCLCGIYKFIFWTFVPFINFYSFGECDFYDLTFLLGVKTFISGWMEIELYVWETFFLLGKKLKRN